MSSVIAEHLSYLQLAGRMDLFRRALAEVVQPGDVVADLGCGLGVLGVAALAAGASRVYGIDHSDAIELARESTRRAGLADRYTCLRGSTFQLDLPETVDLLVCDHIGFFGFDYGIIAMLADARERLLRPGGRIMPSRLRLSLALVDAPEARSAIDAWLDEGIPTEQRWLHEHAVNTRHAIDFTASEVCSDPADFAQIDLTADVAEALSFSLTFRATRDCTVSGLAGWFAAELAPDLWLTNSPLDKQAIRRPNAFLPCRTPFALRAGDDVSVTLKLRHAERLIAWTITPPDGQPRQKLSTWNGRILDPADLDPAREGPVRLGRLAAAGREVLLLADGERTLAQIEDAVIAAHPSLFPTDSEIRKFVRRTLGPEDAR